jgi:hypothetical protein
MPKHFTLTQAEALVALIEESVRQAVALKASYEEAETELQGIHQRIAMLGGAQVDRERLLALRGRRDATAARLKETLEEIHSHGCLVKDLDMGLLDFPTIYRGEEVYLCWRVGEAGISFWHGIHDGFRGRKPIDQEFIDHHQGDLPN